MLRPGIGRDETVEVAVIDTGPGMAVEVVQQAAEPFLTIGDR